MYPMAWRRSEGRRYSPFLFPALSFGQDSKFRVLSLSVLTFLIFSSRKKDRGREREIKREEKRTFVPSDIQIQKRNNSKTCFSHQVLRTSFSGTCFLTLFELSVDFVPSVLYPLALVSRNYFRDHFPKFLVFRDRFPKLSFRGKFPHLKLHFSLNLIPDARTKRLY